MVFSSVFRVFNWNENRHFLHFCRFSNAVLQISGGIDEVGGIQWELCAYLALAWLGCFLIVWKGLHGSGKVKKRRTNFKSKTRKDCLSLKQRQNRLFLSRASPVAELAKNEYFGWSRLSHLRVITAFANSGRGVTSNFNTVCRRSSLDTTLLVLKK